MHTLVVEDWVLEVAVTLVEGPVEQVAVLEVWVAVIAVREAVVREAVVREAVVQGV